MFSALIASAPADAGVLTLTSAINDGWWWRGVSPVLVTSPERGAALGRPFVTPAQAVAACPVVRVEHTEIPAVDDLWIEAERLGHHVVALLRDGDDSQDGGVATLPDDDAVTPRQWRAMMAVDGLSLRAPPLWMEGATSLYGVAAVTQSAYAAERQAALVHPLWPTIRARLEARIEARVKRYAAIRAALDTQGAAWIEALRAVASAPASTPCGVQE